MTTMKRLFGVGGLMALGLVLLQSDCGSGTTTPVVDMASTPDLVTLPDFAPPPDLTTFAAPTVASVAPNLGINNVTTPITITGTNFRAGATVSVGGQACANPSVTSPTTLTCTVAAKAVTCGRQDIVVTNPIDNQVATGAKLFTYRSNGIGFGAMTSLTAAARPDMVVAVDLDNDGDLDLVNTNRNANSITAFLNDGTGKFGAAKPFTTGTNPVGIAAGDLNGDKKADIVVANFGTNTFSVLLGDGAGGFAAKVDTMLAGINSIHEVALADLNGDQKLDVVALANANAAVAIRLGDGQGGFLATPPANVSVGNNPTFVAIADLNGDTFMDLAVSAPGSNAVSVRTGDGKGVFTGTLNLTTGANPGQVVIGDFTGDGKMDILVTSQNAASVGLFAGNGNATFGAIANTGVGTNPIGLTARDLDLDGKLDFVTSNFNGANVSVLLGSGTGTFTAATGSPMTAATGPFGNTVADLNGDTLPDIVSANETAGTLSVFLQTCK